MSDQGRAITYRRSDMGIIFYYLDDDHNIIATKDIEEWGKFFESIPKRRVGFFENENCAISTVFLGIDHGFNGIDIILFETMVFDKKGDGGSVWRRYKTWDEAEKGHAEIVEELKDDIIF